MDDQQRTHAIASTEGRIRSQIEKTRTPYLLQILSWSEVGFGSAPPEVEATREQRSQPIPPEGRLLGPERPFARRDHRRGGAVRAVRQRLRVVLLTLRISLENAPSHLSNFCVSISLSKAISLDIKTLV